MMQHWLMQRSWVWTPASIFSRQRGEVLRSVYAWNIFHAYTDLSTSPRCRENIDAGVQTQLLCISQCCIIENRASFTASVIWEPCDLRYSIKRRSRTISPQLSLKYTTRSQSCLLYTSPSPRDRQKSR